MPRTQFTAYNSSTAAKRPTARIKFWAAAPDVGRYWVTVLGAGVRTVGEAVGLGVATVGSVVIILVGEAVIGALDGAKVTVAEGIVEGLSEALLLGVMVGGRVTIVGTVEGDAEGTSEALTVGDLVGGTATVHTTTLPATSVRYSVEPSEERAKLERTGALEICVTQKSSPVRAFVECTLLFSSTQYTRSSCGETFAST